jgi:hypothetical protein
MRLAMPNTCQIFGLGPDSRVVPLAKTLAISILAERLADPAFGELVLADDAPGINPQQYVHAVTGPLSYLCGIDAGAVPTSGKAIPCSLLCGC